MDSNSSKFIKTKKYKNNFFIKFINKILICFILVILCLIFMKTNLSFNNFINNKVLKDNISFAYLNNLYNKYFGSLFPSYEIEETIDVFNETLEYNNYNIYKNGYKLEVNENYLVPIIESGIVVFIGNIDDYGSVTIVEGIDGVDIWYGNIKNSSISLYDYVSKGDFLGEVNDNYLYLVFEKDQEYLKFEDYIEN